MTEDDPTIKQHGCLALDIATVTGWSYCWPGEQPIWGHRRMGSPNAELGEVLNFFSVWLGATLDRLRPKHVVIESPYVPMGQRDPVRINTATLPFNFAPGRPSRGGAPMNMATVWRLCAMTGHVYQACYERGIDCRDVPTQVWSKFFTGRGGGFGGRQKKKAAAVATAALYGWVATEDEADALGLLVYSEHLLYPKIAQMRRPIGSLRLTSGAAR